MIFIGLKKRYIASQFLQYVKVQANFAHPKHTQLATYE